MNTFVLCGKSGPQEDRNEEEPKYLKITKTKLENWTMFLFKASIKMTAYPLFCC